ncbi:type II secretion system F family protein [Amycolatopsis vastitatis]|uniref:Pilus assembly protein PilC n=1 Tax=Amycolatopsis vastitatis TaxID=1905142 RepID=A0A229TE36_9PSEU|nr:type II secretion system F family protein [Amycolatopsis vastitatis]OXM69164.1 pilus assembly protein PilC [Amycolatopsis vastitatis]
MNRYAYVATGPDGRRTSGVQKAADADSAVLTLYERELRDIEISEKKSVLRLELTAPRVKREVVMHLSRQLGAFVRAGVPLIDAVRILGDETSNSSVTRMLRSVEQGLRGGDRLSDCVDRHPKIFPEFYREILRSAELTGQLDVVLDRLAGYLERDLEARRRVKAALIYPAMIALMSVVTVVVLATFVLPRFRTFFASLDAKLPLPTRMLLGFTDFLGQWWWALLAGLAAGIALYAVAVRTPGGRYARDSVLLTIPAVGPAVRHALVERFCRILASMVGAGVPLPEALRVATDSLRNRVFMRALARVAHAVLEGEGLARPLTGSGLFPVTAAQMIRVGEDTGTLDTQLEVTAQYYEGELDYRLKKLTALFEPVVIVVMGLVVGFVAVALVSAMYGIFDQVHV